MRRVLHAIDTVSEWSGKLVSMLILFMTGVLFLEVMLRYLFNAPTIWAHELTVHLFGSYSVLAGAYVLLHHEHISVDIIYSLFSPRVRAMIDSVTYLLFFLFIVLLLRYGIMTAWRAVELRQTVSPSPWGSPIWPLKLTIPVAALLMLAQGLAHFIRVLKMAITGKELT
ncbi:MAG: TRAP transporter small permease subunit [Desulfatiglandaceae bacterium]|mgnify:CR=1 FL=1|jgi:TRAP-type mannitol/chloroaromatic compound transport system permease small subunit